jgi:hypothetical protein
MIMRVFFTFIGTPFTHFDTKAQKQFGIFRFPFQDFSRHITAIGTILIQHHTSLQIILIFFKHTGIVTTSAFRSAGI